MPIVFVHGVNTREGAGYRTGVELTKNFLNAHLANASIGGKSFTDVPEPLFPYWGDLATTFTWNMASLPHGDMQSLGGAGDVDLRPYLAAIKDAVPDGIGTEPLLGFAKHDFTIAVELIGGLALEQAEAGKEEETAQFVIAIQDFAQTNPTPDWLHDLTTDDQLLGKLGLAVAQQGDVQALGLVDDVVAGVKKVGLRVKETATGLIGSAADRAGDFASTKLLGWTRDGLNENLGRFFGDVFVYFNARGDVDEPGEIPKRIVAALDKAESAAGDEPLVVIGHSLGGVISFDVLSHFRPKLEVDLFVSVGSQIAHFEEMKLYRTSDRSVKPPQHAKTPDNIKRWINIYDDVDIFAYACSEVFDRVDLDVRYDTKTYVIKAHSAYFTQRRFYERLRARIDGLP